MRLFIHLLVADLLIYFLYKSHYRIFFVDANIEKKAS